MKTLSLADQLAPLLDSHEYPRRWKDYIGQEPAKRMLQVAAQSARVRKAQMEHVLIAHPSPGVGKTALASLVASELRSTCRVVSGQLTSGKARLLFSDMKDGDVLIYDEFHQIMDGGPKSAEWIQPVLLEGVIRGPLGPEPIPAITVVATTTEAPRLPEAIVSRFGLLPPMKDYTTDEAGKIAQIMGPRILEGLPKLTKAEALRIATAAHNNPRAIRRLLLNLRDMTVTNALPLTKGRYDIASLLEWQGITHDGLDSTMQRYLTLLATEFGGTAGEKALEDRLQQAGGLTVTERILQDKGLIVRTRGGRTLTQDGISRVRELLA